MFEFVVQNTEIFPRPPASDYDVYLFVERRRKSLERVFTKRIDWLHFYRIVFFVVRDDVCSLNIYVYQFSLPHFYFTRP